MATVAAVPHADQKPKDPNSKEPQKDPLDNRLIPIVFEERKREPDGTLGDVVSRYDRGRVLGKVCHFTTTNYHSITIFHRVDLRKCFLHSRTGISMPSR